MAEESLAQECTMSRRVIFPSLHPKKMPNEGNTKKGHGSESMDPKVDQQRSCVAWPGASSFSNTDSTPSGAATALHLSPLSLTTPSSVPATSEPLPGQKFTPDATQTSTRTQKEVEEKTQVLSRFSSDSLVIPPFKGDCIESGSLSQQPQEADILVQMEEQEEKNHSFFQASQSLPRHRDPSRKPIQSILRSNSTTQTKQPCWSTPKEGGPSNSIPKLASIREDEAEGSESADDTSPHELGYSRSLDCMRSVSFDPRVWVYQFERSREEFDTTWFSEKEMMRFKKQALIKIFVHAVRQQELIPTGTGRIIQRPVRIQTRALFTNPALTMEGDTDDYVLMDPKRKLAEKR